MAPVQDSIHWPCLFRSVVSAAICRSFDDLSGCDDVIDARHGIPVGWGGKQFKLGAKGLFFIST